MGLFDTVIVGVDDSKESKAAADWAAERIAADAVLEMVRLDGDDDADALLAAAEANHADAIVIGGHKGPLERVVKDLLHRITVPLVVTKPAADGDDDENGRPSPPPGRKPPVLACVGYGDATEKAAMWAADYAARRGLPLSLLHVVGYRPLYPADSPSDMLASYFGQDTLLQWATEDLEDIERRVTARRPDVATTTKVDVGFAVRAILAEADGAELVVLGRREGSPALRHMTSPRVHRLVAKLAATAVVVPSCPVDG